MSAPCSLTVVILTYNEDIHIQRAIECVRGIASEILIVDSYSTDETVGLARELGARVIQHPFETQAAQMRWALAHGDIETDWIMRLDADEVVEPDLAFQIERAIAVAQPEITGLVLNRRHIFMDRWIKHGGLYPLYLLRVWRRGCGQVEQRLMDEHIVLTSGRSIQIRGGFADHNLRDLTFFTTKHNVYATREALELLRSRFKLTRSDAAASLGTVSDQARKRRFLKHALYERAGVLAGPLAYFTYRYLLRFGFMDGREGLVYHLLQGFWYRFLVAAKSFELERRIGTTQSPEDIYQVLYQVTGYDLGQSSTEA